MANKELKKYDIRLNYAEYAVLVRALGVYEAEIKRERVKAENEGIVPQYLVDRVAEIEAMRDKVLNLPRVNE